MKGSVDLGCRIVNRCCEFRVGVGGLVLFELGFGAEGCVGCQSFES
jgi:hypothetical protein